MVKVAIHVILTAAASAPDAPTFTPSAGAYITGQQVILTDSLSSAAIHYTLDGSAPSADSPVYTAPLVLSANETVQAIGIVGSLSSAASSAAYSIIPPHLVFSTQPGSTESNATLGPAPAVSLVDGNGILLSSAANPITLNLGENPGKAVLNGTLTVAAVHGIATFPNLSITNAGIGYTLAASSQGMTSSTSATFNVNLPAITVSLPGSSIAVGSTLAGTISLDQPAGVGGVSLSIASSSANIASVSTSVVTIPAGQSTATFTLTGVAPGTSTLSVINAGYSSDTTQLTTVPAAPAIAPSSGSYLPGQQITLTSIVSSALIHYTTDGSVPTAASPLYSGPITLTTSEMVSAIAVQGSLSSSVSSQAFQILDLKVALTPATVSLTSSQTQSFAATVTGSSNAAVTWTVSPSVGTISSAGIYTAPASVTTSQVVTVTATSAVDPTKISTARITLVPAVNVAITPGAMSLSPSQTQSFAAAVSGTSNTAVTWSLSSAIGTISAGGLYTAPASLAASQVVAVTATSAADPTKAASASITLIPRGNVYFLSPTGSDANSGMTSQSPWLSPNHPLNCGDTITAAPGAYSSANFQSGKWGTVTCPAGNNVAWLKCATFDACKVSTSSQFGMYVDKNYWGVQGWEATTWGSGYSCFAAAPNTSTPVTIHHIVFANNVANGCEGGGFSTFPYGMASVDYVAFVGNIAYNSAQGTLHCYSGFSFYEPVNADTASGTHLYIAGNFAWANVNPNQCEGGQPNGGAGIILDTFDGDQTGTATYTAQAVVTNNILLANGSDGVEVQNNVAGPIHSLIYESFNTLWGNSTATNISTSLCADLVVNSGYNVKESSNLVETTAAKACTNNYLYANYVFKGDSTDTVSNNWLYSAGGMPMGSYSSTAFTFGSNTTGVSPVFSNAGIPAAPSCSLHASVPDCMATVISNLTPITPAAKAFGYQLPSTVSVTDTLFPRWLCNVNLPPGLVTMGCQ